METWKPEVSGKLFIVKFTHAQWEKWELEVPNQWKIEQFGFFIYVNMLTMKA